MLGLNYVKRVDELGGRTRPEIEIPLRSCQRRFLQHCCGLKPFDYYTVQQNVGGAVIIEPSVCCMMAQPQNL
ncbi:MAG: hypothetical protein U0X87_04955 [Anaerolineales bacterium]